MRKLEARIALFAAALSLGSCATRQSDPSDTRPAEHAAAAEHAEAGWTTLFDGRTLAGWVTHGGRYDGNALWTVEDGAITGREGPEHAGGLIYTEALYSDFDLELEVKITYPFDSGIFLRMLPPETNLKGAQVTLDFRDDGEVAAIYADGFLAHNESAKAKLKRDEWNRVRVRCAGADMKIEVWLNGELVTDFQQPANTPGFAREGRIGLQVHGDRADPPNSRVQFRNVRVRTGG